MSAEINSIGYFLVHRAMFSHWTWERRKLSRWEAWLWMIAIANYEPKNWISKNELVALKRGEFITSISGLEKAWMWNEHEVRSFLKLLANDKMILKTTTSRYTKITICKYNTYQDISQTEHKQTTDGTQTEHEQSTNGTQQHKEDKEEKKKRNTWEPPLLDEVISYFVGKGYSRELAVQAFNHYAPSWTDSNGKKVKDWKNKMNKVWFKNNEPVPTGALNDESLPPHLQGMVL